MISLALALLRVAGTALVASAAGWIISSALLPPDRSFLLERLGWAFAVGVALLEAFVPLSLWIGRRPGWVPFLVLAGVAAALTLKFEVPSAKAGPGARLQTSDSQLQIALLRLLIVLGVAL